LEELGKQPLSEDEYASHFVGHTTKNIAAMLQERFGLGEPISDLIERKNESYTKLITESDLEAREGLIPLLHELRKFGWSLAIASGSSESTVRVLLRKLRIGQLFSHVVSTDSVHRAKPFPDVYEAALSLVNVPIERVVAIEDSFTGLQAAKNAGMKCLIVPSLYTKSQDFRQSDGTLENFSLLSHEQLLRFVNVNVSYLPKSQSGYCLSLWNSIKECALLEENVTIDHRAIKQDEDENSQITALNNLLQAPPDSLIVCYTEDHRSSAAPYQAWDKNRCYR
jgi:HAD superfamily hydrolase (TIGR01509 family)